MRRHRLHYYTHQGRHKHPTSLAHRIGTGLVLPVFLIALASFAATGAFFVPHEYTTEAGTLLAALMASMARLFSAYALSLLIGIPLGLLVGLNPKAGNFLLPVYDVMESLPILAFFPIAIIFFVQSGFAEGAALLIIFFSTVWTVAFSVISGTKLIPKDVKAAGKVFGLSGLGQLWNITLPGLFPSILTASILAIADGWNLIIVAEALHVYAPPGSASAHDLFGIGSILVSASSSGNTPLLLSAMGVLVVSITLVNIFLWQPLLAKAERFKFE